MLCKMLREATLWANEDEKLKRTSSHFLIGPPLLLIVHPRSLEIKSAARKTRIAVRKNGF
jgi:hypothetical protein